MNNVSRAVLASSQFLGSGADFALHAIPLSQSDQHSNIHPAVEIHDKLAGPWGETLITTQVQSSE